MKAVFGKASIVLCVLFLGGLISCGNREDKSKGDNTSEAPTGKAIIDTTKSQDQKGAEKSASSNAWQYSEEVDKMTSGENYYASIESPDVLQFKSPYGGGSTATLLVRNQEGKDEIVLFVSKGQFLTSVGNGKTLRMRFDENKPISVTYLMPGNGSSNAIFIKDTGKVISMLKSAKHLIIEVEFYNDAIQLINFDVEGFKWDHQ